MRGEAGVGIRNYTSMTLASAKPPTLSEVRIALGLTAALLMFVVVVSGTLCDPRRSDFAEFYAGGLIIREGNASHLYDVNEQTRIANERLNRTGFLLNNHPPFEALLFVALACLPYTWAYLIWGAINVLLWAFSQYLVWRHAPTPASPYHNCFLTLLLFPFWFALILGQTTLLLLFLFTLTFVYLKRNMDFKAGLSLGLGLFKFPVVLPLALICLLRGKWRLIAGFGAAALLLAALSLVAVGLGVVRSYANLLLDIVRNPKNPAYLSMMTWGKMPTVKGLFATFLANRIGPLRVNLLAAMVSAPLLLFTSWQWRREERNHGANSLALMFAASVVISIVTAPHLYAYDLTLMLLAVPLVIASPQWSRRSGHRTALRVSIVILFCPPLFDLLLRHQALWMMAPVLVAFASAAISLARKVGPPFELGTLQHRFGGRGDLTYVGKIWHYVCANCACARNGAQR
jgi:hypothetical protein